MRQWCHKINLNSIQLEPELNAFAEQGWEIYAIFRCIHDNYEIIAFKESSAKFSEEEIIEVLYMFQSEDLMTHSGTAKVAHAIMQYLENRKG